MVETSNDKNDNLQQHTKITKNVLMVAISNVFTILAGVLIGFVIPKIMGVNDYGYYKIFTLYLTYVGLFHFGFIDGIYLLYAGKNYANLDKEKFRMFTKFLFIFQTILLVLITGTSLFFVQSYYGFIFVFIGLSLFINNITTYYQFVSQITYRFKELAIINILKSLFTIISIIILFLLYKFTNIGNIGYQLYIYIYTFINLVLLLWYIYTYRDITFGKSFSFKENKQLILSIFKFGIPLLLSNLIGTLILTVDRQFVSLLFDTDTYSIYAFAYSMLNLVTTAIAAISTVLYPSLKTMPEADLEKNYSKLNGIIIIIVAICLLAHFPLCLIVDWFLQDYSSSLPIFQVIFPSLIFNTAITVVISNYYKSLNLINLYFVKSLIALVLAVIANFIAYLCFKTPTAISVASVIVSIIWYFMMEITLIKRWKISFKRNFSFAILVSAAFYLTTYFISNIYISGVVYLIALIVLILIFEKHNFLSLIKRRIL